MNAQLTTPPISPGDGLSDDPLYEIVDGRRVEVRALPMLSAVVASEIHLELANHIRKNRGLGRLVYESLFHMPITDNDRRPDIAFISAARLPLAESLVPEGDFPLAPDLAIEVVSPTDYSRNVKKKLREYFRNDVKQVWVVYPEDELIEVYDSPKKSRILGEGDILRSELLPGFEVAVDSLFPKA